MAYTDLDSIQRAANGQVASPTWADAVNDNMAAHHSQLVNLPTILKSGQTVVNSSSSGTTISFPVAFPNTCTTVVACIGDSTGSSGWSLALIHTSVVASGFQVLFYNFAVGVADSGHTFRVNWIATGS